MKKCTSFEEQKGTRYIPENVYFGIIIFNCLLSRKPCIRFILNYFVREIKAFYQISLGNEVDFRDLMNVSLRRKLRQGFADERALITTTLTSSCHWKTLVPFCWRKKRLENVFLTLIVNYRKIVQEKKLYHSK